MMKHTRAYLSVVALLCSTGALAEVRINGFASVHLSSVNTDGDTAPFSHYNNENPSFKDESLFALQISSDLGEGLSATVQLVGEGKDDFAIDARWAYISYDINDTHRISTGRFANPIFFQSEYEKVGFAHNYARLPKGVYTGFDFSTIEGIALDSSFYIGDYTLATKVLYGNWQGSTFLAATGREEAFGLENIISIRATLQGDGWNLFGGSLFTEMDGGTVDQNAIFAFASPGISAAEATGGTANDISNFKQAIQWTGKDGIYAYAGFNFDRNNFIVDFEMSHYGVLDSSDGMNDTWFLGLGYRVSDQLAVIVHTESFNQDSDSVEFLDGVQHPALIATGTAIMQNLAFREFEGNGITMRYDFHPSAALKLDWFQGTDTRPNVGDYSIMSAGIDLVF